MNQHTVLTTTRSFFERKYAEASDPWNFAASTTELARYDALMRALQDKHYTRAFEPGCSVGVLTKRLAAICDEVQAMDISQTAVDVAMTRCQDLPNVHITRDTLSGIPIPDNLDLIVFSEIGYYFEKPELSQRVEQHASSLVSGGTFLASHWLGNSSDHILTGDEVHEVILHCTKLRLEHSERHATFRLDRWSRK